MLHASRINTPPPSQVKNATAAKTHVNAKAPETGGELDFLQFLGLQVTDTDDASEAKPSFRDPLGKSGLPKNGETEDPLLSIFDRKERTAWNSIFPELSPKTAGQLATIPNLQSPPEVNVKGVVIEATKDPKVKTLEMFDLKLGKKVEVPLAKDGEVTFQPEKAATAAVISEKNNELPHRITSLNVDEPTPAPRAGIENSTPVIAKKEEVKSGPPLVAHAKNEAPTAGAPEMVKNQPAENAAQKYMKVNRTMEDKPVVKNDEGKSTKTGAVNSKGSESKLSGVKSTVVEAKSDVVTVGDHKSRSKGESEMMAFNSLTNAAQTQALKTNGTPAPTNVGLHPNTVPEVMGKVQTMAKNGGGNMTVTLSPPQLGSLEVKVTTKGKNVEIEMLSQSSQAKSILESKLTELKSSLQSHNLHLTKVEVHVSATQPGEGHSGDMLSQNFGSNSFQNDAQSSWDEPARQAAPDKSAGQLFGQAQNAGGLTVPMVGRTASQHSGSVDLRI